MPRPPEAAFASPIDDRIRCGLCPRGCALAVGEVGECATRWNDGGTLRVSTYGRLGAAAVDPIEKKPLFHFAPGTTTFSVASAGCNLVCPFCQNHGISQALVNGPPRADEATSPEEIVEAAISAQAHSISFTYAEPILQFEFARDVAEVAVPRGLPLVFVTNGQATRPAAEALTNFIRAANVDLKAFSKAAYRDVLGGRLGATTRTIEILVAAGVWVEVTTLVVPGFNDNASELSGIAQFVADLSPDIPWHVSRFHGAYKWRHLPATPPETLRRARNIGLDAGLRHVYTGNVRGDEALSTRCPSCDEVVIRRHGYSVARVDTREGRCIHCGERIAGRELP